MNVSKIQHLITTVGLKATVSACTPCHCRVIADNKCALQQFTRATVITRHERSHPDQQAVQLQHSHQALGFDPLFFALHLSGCCADLGPSHLDPVEDAGTGASYDHSAAYSGRCRPTLAASPPCIGG